MTRKNWLEDWLEIKPNEDTAKNLFMFLNILGSSIPWIVILSLWIFSTSSGNVTIGDSSTNIWAILFLAYPFLLFKSAWKKVEPEQTGAIYLFGLPLITVAPGPYFIFPLFFKLDLDVNQNMAFVITAMDDAGIKKEFGADALDNYEIFRLCSITTATSEIASWNNMGPMSSGLKSNIETDPNHKQVVLEPSVLITLTKEDYISYRRNVEGKNSNERRPELGRQLQFIVKSKLNTEFKKRTYAQLIYMQTGNSLDNALAKEIEILVSGYDKPEHDGSLGLGVLDARVVALGAPESIHNAVNSVVAEKFNSGKKKLEGDGDQMKKTEQAIGEKNMLIEVGKGKAEALKVLLAEAKAGDVDPKRVAELQAEISAFEFGKHTYLTNRQGGNTETAQNELYAQIGIMIADAINKSKGGNPSV